MRRRRLALRWRHFGEHVAAWCRLAVNVSLHSLHWHLTPVWVLRYGRV